MEKKINKLMNQGETKMVQLPPVLSTYAERLLDNPSCWKMADEDIIDANEFLTYEEYTKDGPAGDCWSLYIITMQETRFMYYLFVIDQQNEMEYILQRKFPSQYLLQFEYSDELYEDVVEDEHGGFLASDMYGLHDDHNIREHLITKMENSGLTDPDELRVLLRPDLSAKVLSSVIIAYWQLTN